MKVYSHSHSHKSFTRRRPHRDRKKIILVKDVMVGVQKYVVDATEQVCMTLFGLAKKRAHGVMVKAVSGVGSVVAVVVTKFQ